MGLETATYISQLVPTNPAGGDDLDQGDNHVRMIKDVLQNAFPNLGEAAVVSTAAKLNALDSAVGIIAGSGRYTNGVASGNTSGITSVADGGTSGIFRIARVTMDSALSGTDVARTSKVSGTVVGPFPIMQGTVNQVSSTVVDIYYTYMSSIGAGTSVYVAPTFSTSTLDLVIIDNGV